MYDIDIYNRYTGVPRFDIVDDFIPVLNGEPGIYLNKGNRYVWRFVDQDLIIKIEFECSEQSMSDLHFLEDILDPDDDPFFVQILEHGNLFDHVRGYRAPYEYSREDYFLIEPFYDYVHPRESNCGVCIEANRLANKYSIDDWFYGQWGAVNGYPVIWDIGFGASYPDTDSHYNHTGCPVCNGNHRESLEW